MLLLQSKPLFKYQFFKYSKSKYECNNNIILKYPTVVDDRWEWKILVK